MSEGVIRGGGTFAGCAKKQQKLQTNKQKKKVTMCSTKPQFLQTG